MTLRDFIVERVAFGPLPQFVLLRKGVEVFRAPASAVGADGVINYSLSIDESVRLRGFDEIVVDDGVSAVRRKQIPEDLKLAGDSLTIRWTVTITTNEGPTA